MDVPAIEVVRTVEVLTIEAERTRAESTEGVRPPPAKEEAREDEVGDGIVSVKLLESAKIAQGLIEVSPLLPSFCGAGLFLEVLSCNA